MSPKTSGSNPFATRFIRPDARPFLFPEGVSAVELVDQLQCAGWKGQIVGPHGSGKSTLLETLLPLVADRGRDVFLYRLHDGQRRLTADKADRDGWTQRALLAVDGYEQLSWWSRRRLQFACRRLGCGLLITTHRRQRCPLLYQAQTNLSLLEQLVEQLTANEPPAMKPTAAQIRQAFDQQGGNLREALLQLYDVFETARRANLGS